MRRKTQGHDLKETRKFAFSLISPSLRTRTKMGTLFWIVLFCFIYISLGDDDPTPPPGYEGWTPPRGYEGTTRGYEGWTTTPGYEGSTTSQSEYSTTGRYQSEDSTVGHRPNPESDKHNYQHEKGRSPFNEGNNSVLGKLS